LRIASLDLAFHGNGQLVQGAVGSEHMGDVAEGVLLLVEPAIGANVDAPTRHVLPGMIARGQPQHVDHTRSRRVRTVIRQVRDLDTHAQKTGDR
jgi:hypothetical protein